ncbi:MAG: SMP-30/gluconolactonase/LRE family protein, partial [Cytophagales bacterium]
MKKKLFLLIGFMTQVFITFSQETRELARYKPISVIDLRTSEGTQLVDGKWTYKVGKIQPVKFNSPGPSKTDNLNLYPTGKSVETQNLFPNLKDSTFSNKNWTSILPTELEERKGNGRLSFVWYRVNFTIPTSINNAKIDGKVIYFEITADDYTEMYINGQLKKGFGQTGAGVVSGYNARNRVVLTSDAKAGEKFEISILVANGPFGDEPDNYVWIRNAVLDIYSPDEIASQNPKIGSLNKIENAFDEIIAPNTKAEKLADGFSFTEGPVWHPDGFLLFSDPNMNMIYRFNPKNNNVTIFQSHSGYTGTDIGNLGQPGSNGLAIDNEGRLIVCQHGNRRVIRHETKGPITVLADKIDGKRLNSPNDIVLKSDGTVYFTDPPYGLEKHYSDSKKELDYQ